MKSYLNKSQLENWKEVDPENWVTHVCELSHVFFEVAPVQVQGLKQSLEKGEVEKVGKYAHTLKSSCGNVGADSARIIFQKIEDAAHNKDLTQIQSLMNEAFSLFEISVAELKEYVQKIQAA